MSNYLSAILYVARTPLTKQHQRIHAGTCQGRTFDLFIRSEVVEGDVLDAIRKALPLPLESVLDSCALVEDSSQG